jgi:hypothetical protein
MLVHLHQRVAKALAPIHEAMLTTFGPADIQTSYLPCEAIDLDLYMLIPRTSDHLFNLEFRSDVVVTTHGLQGRGTAHIVEANEQPSNLALCHLDEAHWSALARIALTRLQLTNQESAHGSETIDLERI